MKTTITLFAAGLLFLTSCGGGQNNNQQGQVSPEEKKAMDSLETKTTELETIQNGIKQSSANLDALLNSLN